MGSTGPVPARPEPLLRPLPRLSLEFLLVAAATAVIVIAMARLRLVVLPVFAALLATTFLLPVVRRLRANGVPSGLASFLAILMALLVLGLALVLIVPPAVQELGDLGTSAREGLDEVTRWLAEGPLDLNQREIDDAVDSALDAARDNVGGVAHGVVSGATLAAEIVAGFLIALVLTFFFLHDGERIWRWVLSMIPQRHRHHVDAFGDDAFAALGGYLRGVAIVALVDATFIGLGLLALGVPLVLPIALLTFLAAFLPLVGAVVAGAVAALVALVTQGAVDAILVVLIVTAVQQIEGDLLYPLVVGKAIELHPVATLLAVTAGGVLGGIVGAAIGVPVVAVVWAAIRRWREQAEFVPEPARGP